MKNMDFTIAILVDQTPKEAFDAVNDVIAWWTENLTGASQKLDDEFEVRFWDVHYSRQKLIEVMPGKRVVWLITDSRLTFIKNETEWIGTKISFDISKQGDKTEVCFTHHGLMPQIECFANCSNAWSGYITKSLYSLITTGTGQPTKKEN